MFIHHCGIWVTVRKERGVYDGTQVTWCCWISRTQPPFLEAPSRSHMDEIFSSIDRFVSRGTTLIDIPYRSEYEFMNGSSKLLLNLLYWDGLRSSIPSYLPVELNHSCYFSMMILYLVLLLTSWLLSSV